MRKRPRPLPADLDRLKRACELGNAEEIKATLDETDMNVDVALTERGATALMCACVSGSHDAIEALLDYGANPYVVDVDGHVALLYTFGHCELHTIEHLWELYEASGGVRFDYFKALADIIERDDRVQVFNILNNGMAANKARVADEVRDNMGNYISRVIMYSAWDFLPLLLPPAPARSDCVSRDHVQNAALKDAPAPVLIELARHAQSLYSLDIPLHWNADRLQAVAPLLSRLSSPRAEFSLTDASAARICDPLAVLDRIPGLSRNYSNVIATLALSSDINVIYLCWAILRLTREYDDTFKNALSTNGCAAKWRVWWPELNSRSDSYYIDDAKDSTSNIDAMLEHGYVNPFARDMSYESRRRRTYKAGSPVLRHLVFRPLRHVARWYGPYFQRRAFCFLLCCERWRREGTHVVGRDVRLYILRKIAALEYL